MVRLTPEGDFDLPGNLYAREPDAEDLSHAILAVAFELRTANMIAARALNEEDQKTFAPRLDAPAKWDWTLRRYTGKHNWFLETDGTQSVRGEIVLRAVAGCILSDLGATWSKDETSSTKLIYVEELPFQVPNDEARLTIECRPFTNRTLPSTPFEPLPVRLDLTPRD